MYRVLLLALFFGFAAPSIFAQDPVKVDPNHYKVEFENARVRVLRIKVGPGEKTPMHSHPDSVLIFQTEGRVRFTYPGGKTEETTMQAGQVVWTPAVTHQGENLSDQPIEVIQVELKNKHAARSAPKKAI